MVSMKDIASRCGVSIATVSKALNGQKDIGESTRETICRMAEEMGYLTNSAARALKTNRTYNIGVLLTDEQNSGLTHPYFSSLLENFKTEAEQKGYDITFINQNVGAKPTSYLQHCKYRSLDGVVIANVDFEDPRILELVNSDIPVVTVDHLFNNRTAVISDNVDGIAALVEYVHSLGHERIAMIHGERKSSVTRYRLTSFYRTCQTLDIKVPDEYIRQSSYIDPEQCARETEALLRLKNPPTCIFFPDDFSGIGGMGAISRMGLRIPQDISVVGYDGIHVSQVITPKLTTYQQDTAAIGRRAANELIRLIEQPKVTLPEQINVSGMIIKGESVRDLRS